MTIEPATFSVDEVATMLGVEAWLESPLVLPGPAVTGGYVYFLMCETPDLHIKIGHARNMRSRVSGMQTGCPYRLRVVAYFHNEDPGRAELDMHFRLAADHLGGEWFRLTRAMKRAISEVRSTLDPPGDRAFLWRGKLRA